MTTLKKGSSTPLIQFSEKLDLNAFRAVLDKAYQQISTGKGKERHGKDKDFHEQPWRVIADHVGPEFLVGQAVKKLMELKAHAYNENNALAIGSEQAAEEAARKWHTDAVGAIVYTAMAIMYKDYTQSLDEEGKSISFGKSLGD